MIHDDSPMSRFAISAVSEKRQTIADKSAGLYCRDVYGTVRGIWVYPNTLRGNSNVDVKGSHVFRGDGNRADHSFLIHVNARKNCRVIRDAHTIVEAGHCISDILLVDNAVRMAVDVRVVAYRDAIPHYNAAAVVEQNVTMHNAVISDFHVVAEGKLDMLKRLEVLADALEDFLSEDSAQLNADLDILRTQYRPVE